jgi:hypothetical protein
MVLKLWHLQSGRLGQCALADIKGEEFPDSKDQRVRNVKNVE